MLDAPAGLFGLCANSNRIFYFAAGRGRGGELAGGAASQQGAGGLGMFFCGRCVEDGWGITRPVRFGG